jgi:hypothetical protein
MRPADQELAGRLVASLTDFDERVRPLPGIHDQINLECLVEQVIDSIRRIRYVETIRERETSVLCSHPDSIAFDPFKAAIYFKSQDNINEAFWMIFLGTHFGKHVHFKWGLTKSIYGSLNSGHIWSWDRVSANIDEFRRWLHENQVEIKENGRFSNHRKYQSLGAYNNRGTGSTFASYVDWIGEDRDHLLMINRRFSEEVLNDPRRLFNALYKSLSNVMGFGRTAKFDFLTMIGKIGLLNIVPDSTYMGGATGPKRGAKLLFGGDINSRINGRDLERYLLELDRHLNLHFGMQVLEDSLCNWQKSPASYLYFGG